MVANTGPKEDGSSETEGPSAVATMTRLIHDLYASNGACATIRGGRETNLINWNEMLVAVRDRDSAPGSKLEIDN
jgi:hypothetical protein